MLGIAFALLLGPLLLQGLAVLLRHVLSGGLVCHRQCLPGGARAAPCPGAYAPALRARLISVRGHRGDEGLGLGPHRVREAHVERSTGPGLRRPPSGVPESSHSWSARYGPPSPPVSTCTRPSYPISSWARTACAVVRTRAGRPASVSGELPAGPLVKSHSRPRTVTAPRSPHTEPSNVASTCSSSPTRSKPFCRMPCGLAVLTAS